VTPLSTQYFPLAKIAGDWRVTFDTAMPTAHNAFIPPVKAPFYA
jgi:hypothetical protein